MRTSVFAAVCVAVVLAASVSGAAATTKMTWTSCSAASSPCPPSNVTMSPDPAVRGKDVTFSLTCDGTGPAVTGGKSTNIIYLFGIKVLEVTKDLCTLTKCPIEPGVHTISGGMTVPSITPTNEPLKMVQTNTDQNGNQINCVNIMYEVVA